MARSNPAAQAPFSAKGAIRWLLSAVLAEHALEANTVGVVGDWAAESS